MPPVTLERRLVGPGVLTFFSGQGFRKTPAHAIAVQCREALA